MATRTRCCPVLRRDRRSPVKPKAAAVTSSRFVAAHRIINVSGASGGAIGGSVVAGKNDERLQPCTAVHGSPVGGRITQCVPVQGAGVGEIDDYGASKHLVRRNEYEAATHSPSAPRPFAPETSQRAIRRPYDSSLLYVNVSHSSQADDQGRGSSASVNGDSSTHKSEHTLVATSHSHYLPDMAPQPGRTALFDRATASAPPDARRRGAVSTPRRMSVLLVAPMTTTSISSILTSTAPLPLASPSSAPPHHSLVSPPSASVSYPYYIMSPRPSPRDMLVASAQPPS
jgi:hypothetical protein